MPLSGITTNVQQGGIGRRAPSNDKISGLLWYSATYPAGFDANNQNKKVFSLAEAEDLGIVDSDAAFSVLHYQVSEYFRTQPEGELWIGIHPVPGTGLPADYVWAEIPKLFAAAAGEIRQLGIYANLLDFVATQCTAIEAVIAAEKAKGFRASVLYAPNFPASTDWTTVTDLRTLNAPSVTVVIAQDGGGEGADLFTSKAFSVPALGAALGCVSKASVQQSIGNPANFNISDGSEMEVLALANGDLLGTDVSDALLGNLKDKGFLVARKYTPRLAGSFFERCPTAVAATSDYAWIEYNRTIDKAVRQTEIALLPTLQAGVPLKSDGTLREDTIGYYQDLAGAALVQMMADGEISGEPSDLKQMVLINPAQNVLQTSTLVVTIKILPVGVAEFITINIGLTTSLS